MEIEIKVEITDQDICDIVCTAFEGGITYWCDEAIPLNKDGNREHLGDYASDQLIYEGGTLKLHEEEEDEYLILTKENLLNGIKTYLEHSNDNSILYFNEKMGKLGIDTCQIDACIADEIVQYAVFGEVVYG